MWVLEKVLPEDHHHASESSVRRRGPAPDNEASWAFFKDHLCLCVRARARAWMRVSGILIVSVCAHVRTRTRTRTARAPHAHIRTHTRIHVYTCARARTCSRTHMLTPEVSVGGDLASKSKARTAKSQCLKGNESKI